jgi:hypothetical protein
VIAEEPTLSPVAAPTTRPPLAVGATESPAADDVTESPVAVGVTEMPETVGAPSDAVVVEPAPTTESPIAVGATESPVTVGVTESPAPTTPLVAVTDPTSSVIFDISGTVADFDASIFLENEGANNVLAQITEGFELLSGEVSSKMKPVRRVRGLRAYERKLLEMEPMEVSDICESTKCQSARVIFGPSSAFFTLC